jgi:hypothetical protein
MAHSSASSSSAVQAAAGSEVSEPDEPARPRRWATAVVYACFLAASVALTWRLWAHPSSLDVAGNVEDSAQFAWFVRYAATAVVHGHLPTLVTTAMNVPRGISLMWNTTILLPGVLLTPVTVLAGPQASLTLLLTLGFAGSAASLFYVLRRCGASVPAAAVGGAVYGFSPALTHAAIGHYQLQFAVLPPLIVDAVLRLCLGTARPARAGAWLGLLVAAQIFIGEEVLFDTAIAATLVVLVLALSRPRGVPAAARPIVIGLTSAAVVTLLLAGWALRTQFFGPLTEQGSPFARNEYINDLAAFVTPTSAQLLHTSASAAARFQGLSPEWVAYLGWPLIVALVLVAVVFWRRLPVRACAVTAAALLLLSVGAHPIVDHHVVDTRITLPWGLFDKLPVVQDLQPDRLSITADGAAAGLLAFGIDLTWRRLCGISLGRRSRGQRSLGRFWAAAIVGALAVAAVLPLVPLPLAAQPTVRLPAGWAQTLSALHLQPGARVLVVPVPTPALDDALRWQADVGEQISLIGGYFEGPDPAEHDKATITAGHVLPLSWYLDHLWSGLWSGTRRARPPSRAAIRKTLRYWRPQAVVAAAPSPRLLRYLEGIFGRPTIGYGSMVGWLIRRPL